MSDPRKPLPRPDLRPSPGTDPTNPWRQEAAGLWLANEQANERRVDEPGLTDWDREARARGMNVPKNGPLLG